MEDHTNKNLKLATWNLCLGLANKKELVSQKILEEKIDVCVMQEIEIPNTYDANLLSFKGYSLIVEKIKSSQGQECI